MSFIGPTKVRYQFGRVEGAVTPVIYLLWCCQGVSIQVGRVFTMHAELTHTDALLQEVWPL